MPNSILDDHNYQLEWVVLCAMLGMQSMETTMASVALEQVRSKALGLSEMERAELAHDLVASLDGAIDSDAATEWDAELLRRLAQVDSGTPETIDRTEFKRQMDARIGRV